MRDYSARLPGFCVKPCSHAFSKGPLAMKCCAGCWGGPSFSRSPHPLSSGRGSIFRARMRRHHARARKAAGLRRDLPRIVRKSVIRPKKIRAKIYCKNGHFLRVSSELYILNEGFLRQRPALTQHHFGLHCGVLTAGHVKYITSPSSWRCER